MKSYFLFENCRFCEGYGQVINDKDKIENCNYCAERGYCPVCSEVGYTQESGCSICTFQEDTRDKFLSLRFHMPVSATPAEVAETRANLRRSYWLNLRF